MTTINNAVFLSDDEEDESFHGSDISSEEERDLPDDDSELISKKREKSTLSDVIRNRKVEKIYNELLDDIKKEFNNGISRIKRDDFMLEFQKKCSDSHNKKNSDLRDLKNYVNLGISKVFEEPVEFDISKYKRISRSLDKELEEETRKLVEKAIGDIDKKSARYIDKKVRYAGETFTIRERIDSSEPSKKNRVLNNDSRSLTGMTALDELVLNLDKGTNINSIQKSQSDWSEFRQITGIESQLEKQRKYGYISKTAFLQKVDWKSHEKELELRKKLGKTNNDNVNKSV